MREAAKPPQFRGKPLLFVDIDGVLSLFGFASDNRPEGRWLNVDGIAHLISATASQHLHRLSGSFELVWCSGWEEKANAHLLRVLALPAPLPHLTFSDVPGAPHWKLPAIGAYAGDRPLAWIDDAHDDACRAWARARPAPTLLVSTLPEIGLTDVEVELIEQWACATSAGAPPDADERSSMSKQAITTDAAPPPGGPYSQAVRAGDLVFLAGQIPARADGTVVDGDFEAQVRQVLANLAAVAEAAGGSLDDLVRIGVYITDMGHFDALNRVCREVLGDPLPVRTTIPVALRGFDVEIDGILLLGSG